jgi:hypothetical protein
MEVKKGDLIKYDSEDSILTWYGVVTSVREYSVTVKNCETDPKRTERVLKKNIVGIY